MRSALVVGLVSVVVSVVAGADPKPKPKTYRGAMMDLYFESAEVSDLAKIIADTGRINIVLIDVPPTQMHIKEKAPWDKILDGVVANAKLDYVRTGNTYLIGQPAWVAERKKAGNKKVFKLASIDLRVKKADASAVASLVASATSTPMEITGGAPRQIELRLSRVPADQAFDVVLAQSGGTAVAKPSALGAPAACVADAVPLESLALVAIATVGIKRTALFVDPKGAPYLVTAKTTCFGAGKAKVKEVGDVYVTYVQGGIEDSTLMFPPTQ